MIGRQLVDNPSPDRFGREATGKVGFATPVNPTSFHREQRSISTSLMHQTMHILAGQSQRRALS